MAEIAETFFAKSWIDAKPRPGKTGGAFSHPTVPSAHPFILMSYLGKTRDVMTLAHELGHGVHQVMAAHHGPDPQRHAVDARRNRKRLRRNADLSRAAEGRARTARPRRDARLQSRGHAQHGRAPNRVLHLRAAHSRRPPRRRTDAGRHRPHLDGGANAKAWALRSISPTATRPIGATSRTSSMRRSTSTPMRSAIVW